MFRALLALVCISGIFSLPTAVFGAELNAGFVQGLWYGNENIVANEPTRIYVALRNNTDHDLTGTVRFNDNGTRIGIAYVNALPGRIVEAWVDWTPRYGEHTITASLSDVRVHTIGETPENAEVENTIAQDTVFVDYDTDSDGTLNEKDTDDDNDSISDVDENTQGTNPLIKNNVEKDDSENTEKGEEEQKEESPKKETPRTRSDAGDTITQVGLEQYVPEGIPKDIVENVTEVISETKNDLDTYREERKDALAQYFSNEETATTTLEGDSTATITRSHVKDDESLFESVIRSGKALISGFYTLILWIASRILAHPAILELLLLILIIYIIYRSARRLGRRRLS